jgi:hypothetical protein
MDPVDLFCDSDHYEHVKQYYKQEPKISANFRGYDCAVISHLSQAFGFFRLMRGCGLECFRRKTYSTVQ